MLDQESARTRRRAHAQLDREFLAYRSGVQRFERNPLARVLAGDPIRDVRAEARSLVASRYSNCTCRRLSCESCYRVHALLRMSGRCDTRAQFKPIMDWIMDPEFLT